jgi:uncharacterized membrane protein (UPF0182 family)
VSDGFDRPRPRPAKARPAGPPSSRARTLAITGVILLVGFMVLTGFASFWTERLWFISVGYRDVFSTLLWTRIGLFLAFGGLMAAAVAVSIAVAYRARPVIFPGMPGQHEDGMDRYRALLTPVMTWVVAGASTLVGLFAGASASGQWRSYSLWRHGGDFGTKDPYFGKDAGFYVFDLPWWHFLVDFVMAVAVVALLAAVLVHYVFGGIRLGARPGERFTGAAQVQVSLLLGFFVVAKAVDYWLDRYDLVNGSGALFTGMGYTDHKAVLPAKEILTGIAVVCALLFFANIWRRTWLLPSVGVALFALSAIILGMVIPGVVQQVQVSPNVPDKESPYLARNIEATHKAYGLDRIEKKPFAGTEVTSDGRLAALDGMTSSVPLVDPKVVSQTFELQQQVRPYYSVSDVLDVDRYEIEGKERAVVLAVREMDQTGISEEARTWANLHTVYTHGEGVIAAYANQRPADDGRQSGGVQWAEGNEANQNALSSLGDGLETRVYFGEKSPAYSIVGAREGAKPIELDLPEGEGEEESDSYSTYDGKGGVEVGGIVDKLLFALRFGEPNLVLSTRVHDNSRILYDRQPRTMVEKVAPWLTVDSDPYPAVIDGRIQWIVDGYTVTDKYPLAQRESLEQMTADALRQNTGFQTLPTDEVNYLRNSVKATVDAYDGTVTLYEWDTDDPILKAWRGVFPDVVKPKSEIPDSLMQHLRYPEDLFKAQRYQYQRYHITDAQAWLEGSERWEAPKDPQAKDMVQAPYRLFTDAEGEGENWSLTSVYVWPKRDKLAAFMGVDSDATSPDYGKISVLELPNEATDGPRLIANTLSTNDEVRDRLLPYTQGDAKPIYGNLLTLPVGDDFMYVQPLYTKRDSESAFPVLSFVLVSYKGEVGIGTTLRAAIADSLGVEDTGPKPPKSEDPPKDGEKPDETPPKGTQAQIRDLLRQAETKFNEADEAQRNGDTVEWARLIEEARELIEEAAQLAAD